MVGNSINLEGAKNLPCDGSPYYLLLGEFGRRFGMQARNDVASRLKTMFRLESEPTNASELIEQFGLKWPKLPDDLWLLLGTLLGYFMKKGSWPSLEEINPLVAGKSRGEVEDLLRRAIESRYVRKGSGTNRYLTDLWLGSEPTMHRVKVRDGAEIFAGCALDGMWAFALTKESGTMKTICPRCGEKLLIEFERGRITTWEPEGMVLFVGAKLTGNGNVGELCCPYINLFGSQEHLESWLSKLPEVGGITFPRAQALELAATVG